MYNVLVAQANIYARQYYFLGKASVEDSTYDKLIQDIEIMEKSQGFCSEVSPTQRVGWFESLSVGDKDFTHIYQKCLSLGNIRTSDELTIFSRGSKEIVATPKLDGCAGMLYYNQGRLTNVSTRGDGLTGQDITHLHPYIKNIPAIISTDVNLRIEGEFLCPTFTTSMGKNQRNYVAGSLGLKTAEDRKLVFVAYNVVYENDADRPDTYTEILEFLRSCKDIVCVGYSFTNDVNELRAVFSVDYKYTDGIVFKYNSTAEWNSFTRHHPNFAVAYKFAETEYQTKLLGVQWQTGKGGQVTPVAILDPVEIDGTTVSRASLANLLNIKARKIKIFDIVNVIKAGSVIPQVVSVFEEAHDRITIECVKCPSCYSVLEDKSGILYCRNSSCGDIKQKLMESFTKALGIKGLGPSFIKRLRDAGLLDSFSDLFVLTESLIVERTTISSKLAPKIIASIQASKTKGRYIMWSGLGITNFGKAASERVYKEFKSLVYVTTEGLTLIPRIGETVSTNVVEWVRKNKEELILLEDLFSATEIEEPKGIIVLTGKMSESRSVIAERLEKKGWKVSNTVTKHTDILIYGTSAGTKLDRARVLNINTIDYFDSKSMLNIL